MLGNYRGVLGAQVSSSDLRSPSVLTPVFSFVLVGLPTLMDQVLITNCRKLRSANTYGADKMCRNIMALQQNLLNVGSSPLHVDFDRSRRYYELLRANSAKVRLIPRTIDLG